MVGEILDTHLLATLTRAVYANSPSQWVKSVITRYFFRALLCSLHPMLDAFVVRILRRQVALCHDACS